MALILRLWAKEPALFIGAVEAVIALAIGFGLDLTVQQVTLIIGAVSAIGALITRMNVWSPASVAKLVGEPLPPKE